MDQPVKLDIQPGPFYISTSFYIPSEDKVIRIELDLHSDGSVTWRPRGGPVGQRGFNE